ncbi:putative bifunctional diguanylate cyclase/phosphodiesterase [Mariniblastus fucicola]|uniref:Phytochrome-like protein cph2 n=1 Tax=Mariniblastus fucicola TaxID=980251 RepID=A0A5B9PBF6_9BACT|nr:bifunctional diguanylate cyclase/phosphodiesterase [Mariniblastus fucicola]QEG22535.1 Phytochrome-like protein cph2 [Mariniblastus fucicola]
MYRLFDQPKTDSNALPVDKSFDDKVLGSILHERVLALSTYLCVVGLLWGFASSFIFWKRGIIVAAVPFSVMGTILLLAFVERMRWLKRLTTINLFLATNYVGLLFVSACSEYRESTIEFHFALICLMAVQLLGMKAALRWFSLTIVAIFISLYSPVVADGQLTLGNSLDHLVSAIAFAATILWICEHAERSFVRRTAQLQRLADLDHEKSRMLRLAEETASIGHWRLNLQSGETVFSDELKRICHLPELDHLDTLLKRFDSPGQDELRAALKKASVAESSFSLELSFVQDDGERHITCRGFSELGPNGNVEAVFGVIRDETRLWETTQRLSRKAEELNQLAIIDPLTGLSNRLWFRNQLETMIENAMHQQEQLALIVLDMDGFKEINDTLGHAIGDLVLIETAKRISSLVTEKDVVSRLGGDEFTVIVRSAESIDHVATLSQKIVDLIREPMHFENTKMQVGASIGISACPDDSRSADELFTFADTAMYDAKFSSKDVSVYHPSMTEELIHRKKVESQLSEAADRDEFSLVFQPQYQIQNRKVIGFEALIRWNHNGKVVSPADFIPVLESSGRIIETGQWILDQAFQQMKEWQDAGFDTRVAVNISPVQFRDPDFYDRVVDTLNRHGVCPENVDLEITEGAIISDVTHTAATLKKLKSVGCMISIDDFGTGYSSLAYLKNFPIDQLKIDQAFVKDIPHHDDGTIASSIVVLGLSLGMEVLAEGVETKEQLEFLHMHDCEFFQGFLGSRPLPAKECMELLLRQQQSDTPLEFA